MICEFRKLKFESQCITNIKEIKQLLKKSICDFDQRFKILMAKVSFQMLDAQHKEWFIVALLLHIQGKFLQHKVVSQTEALKIAMKLESSSIENGNVGMMQIQSQLANLTVQL